MQFKKEDLQEILSGYSPTPDFTIIESGKWEHDTSNSDYETKYVIFKYKDKFYEIDDQRSGSPYSDFWYESRGWPDTVPVREVVKEEVIVLPFVSSTLSTTEADNIDENEDNADEGNEDESRCVRFHRPRPVMETQRSGQIDPASRRGRGG